MNAQLEVYCIPPSVTLRETLACIDRNSKGIALVIDGERNLLATITDGDIRRAILAGTALDAPIQELLARKDRSEYPSPITARVGTDRAELLDLMRVHVIRHIPLLDSEGRVADLVTLDEFLPDQIIPLQAVIMAGGAGTRLRPLTEDLPKPMLPVGDRPLMEHIIAQLAQVGIRRVHVTTHYKAEKIIQYFGDGKKFGVELDYVTESRPLGTAGALGLMPEPREPLLVINGDILTRVDFRALIDFHREQNAVLTLAVRRFDWQVPYGVVESEGALVRGVREKPLLNFLVNAGIYLLEPEALHFVANGEHLHMTELIERLIAQGCRVASFPIIEYWLDIGQHQDYAQAQTDFVNGRWQ